MQSINVHVTPRTQTRQGRKTCSPQTGAGAPTPGPREPTFRDWSIVMKDGIMDVRSVYGPSSQSDPTPRRTASEEEVRHDKVMLPARCSLTAEQNTSNPRTPDTGGPTVYVTTCFKGHFGQISPNAITYSPFLITKGSYDKLFP